MDDIFEYLEDAIEILVLFQFDQIPFKCEGCEHQMQCDMNCAFFNDEPKEESVYFNKFSGKEYYSCPMSMIPKCVFDWYDQYLFIKEFGTPMYPESTSSLFWWFVKTYNAKKNQLEIKIQEKRMAESRKKNGKHR